MSTPPFSSLPKALFLPAILDRLRSLLPENRVFLVGGAVRDAILGRPEHDLDFVVTEDNALRMAREVADRLGEAYYALDRERGTGRVVAVRVAGEPMTLDFAQARGGTLADDLWARDFTINALALPLSGRYLEDIIDPTGGLADLASAHIRAVRADSLLADPVRCLRAVRVAHELGFALTEGTAHLVHQAAPRLAQVSSERARDELVKILALPTRAAALDALDHLGVLVQVVPEVEGLGAMGLWGHTLASLDRLYNPAGLEDFQPELDRHLAAVETGGRERRTLLALAALLHEAGALTRPPENERSPTGFPICPEAGVAIAAARLQHLRFSAAEIRRVSAILAGQGLPSSLQTDPEGLSLRAIHRYYRDLGDCGPEVALLSLACLSATQPERDGLSGRMAVVRTLLDHFFHRYRETVAPPPLLNGHELMRALGLPPGPRIGALLAQIREAQAAGEVHSREEALRFAAQWAKEMAAQGPTISMTGS